MKERRKSGAVNFNRVSLERRVKWLMLGLLVGISKCHPGATLLYVVDKLVRYETIMSSQNNPNVIR